MGYCMRNRIAVAAVMAVAFAVQTSADEAKKLKTQTITLKVQFEPRDSGKSEPIHFDMIQLPAGKITLKDKDGKDVEHTIKPIWLGKYEVRWNDYDPFWQQSDLDIGQRRNGVDAKSRPSKPYSPPDGGYGVDGYPAGEIHYVAAQQYCDWLSKQTGKKFRLPTEAEWEYACRAGGPPVKLETKELDKVAWYSGNSKEEPHAVGKKAPNAWGFYDMLGNVAEFVVTDPSDKTQGCLAGGSYEDEAVDVTSGAREPYTPKWQIKDGMDPVGKGWMHFVHRAGFRVVMEDSDEPKRPNPLAPNSK